MQLLCHVMKFDSNCEIDFSSNGMKSLVHTMYCAVMRGLQQKGLTSFARFDIGRDLEDDRAFPSLMVDPRVEYLGTTNNITAQWAEKQT